MDKKTVNPGLIFLLVLLVAAGLFLVYSRLTFTGYVTNVANATNGVLLSSNSFDNGDFSNTVVDSNDNIVLIPTKTTGTYTSEIIDAGANAVWTGFAPTYVTHSSVNYTDDPVNNSIQFFVRACNDSTCSTEDFAPYSPGLDLVGEYFQYRAAMQILSGTESPQISEVNVSHYPPNTLLVNIDSPQNITYNNESVFINLSSDNPGATIWFYDGTNNQVYTSPVNEIFAEGSYVLNAYASYLDGNINYTSSNSVAFTVGFLHTFYRFANNACSAMSITNAEKTANDYNSSAACQANIVAVTNTSTTNDNNQNNVSCAPVWSCSYYYENGTSTDWSPCVDGVQTRTCTDTETNPTCVSPAPPASMLTHACTGGTVTTPPATTTPATTTTTTPATTTTANSTNKGFFNFVGSAIVGPIFKSTIGIIAIIVLVLIVGGFFAYKYLLAGRFDFMSFFGLGAGKSKKKKFQF